MEVIIDTSQKANINWNAKGTERIIQNIVNLLNTFRYEVAYDRTIGLTGKFIDKPLDHAVAEATSEMYELITIYEPRATLKEVQYIGLDDKGNMQFKVVVDIG